MSKINILPESVSNLIAAGEVVERPGSAVKELVENSIDAGATLIRIEIRNAGRKLISVTDNGSGMDQEDALLCLQPHGTSKIAEAGDIDAITTLGFRGEALPSIAAVSRLRIRTKTADSLEGFEVETEAGRITDTRPCGMAKGTSIEIRDLFFNVPARKKFLRSAPTEEAHIQETVISIALPHPEVGFELIFDSSVLFKSAPSSGTLPRISEFFGKKQASEFLEIAPQEIPGSNITICGFIAPPGVTKGSRREQRFFVNGRAVESAVLFRGVKDGYGERCEAGRFPPVILFITMPPEEFDINVHPTKKEIRFRDETKIAPAVAGVVAARLAEALRNMAVLSPEIEQFSPEQLIQGAMIKYLPEMPQSELPGFNSDTGADNDEPVAASAVNLPLTASLTDATARRNAYRPEPLPPQTIPESRVQYPAPTYCRMPEMRFIGIFNELYILVTCNGELRIIDQHAAHERILFERLQDKFASGHPSVQQLLIPEQLELDKKTLAFFTRHQKSLMEYGFDLTLLSSNTIMINGLPADLPPAADAARCIREIFDSLMESGGANWLSVPRDVLARAACRSAIKGNDKISESEAVALINDLQKCKKPDCCPHGRPTMITISPRELERRFGRT